MHLFWKTVMIWKAQLTFILKGRISIVAGSIHHYFNPVRPVQERPIRLF